MSATLRRGRPPTRSLLAHMEIPLVEGKTEKKYQKRQAPEDHTSVTPGILHQTPEKVLCLSAGQGSSSR